MTSRYLTKRYVNYKDDRVYAIFLQGDAHDLLQSAL